MSEPSSEVAKLKRRLVEEYEAGQRGLAGLAEGTARHRFISQKTENMARYHRQLIALVGEAHADQILMEVGL